MIRWALHGATFPDTELEGLVRAALAARFDALAAASEAVRADVAERGSAALTRDRLAAARVALAAIDATADVAVTFAGSPRSARDAVERCEALGELAEALVIEGSAPALLVVRAGAAPRGVRAHEIVEETAGMLERIADRVGGRGVRVALAPTPERGASIADLRAARHALAALVRPDVGLAVDTRALAEGGEGIPDAERILHVTVADGAAGEGEDDDEDVEPATGAVPILPVLLALVRAGWTGLAALRWERAEHRRLGPAKVAPGLVRARGRIDDALARAWEAAERVAEAEREKAIDAAGTRGGERRTPGGIIIPG